MGVRGHEHRIHAARTALRLGAAKAFSPWAPDPSPAEPNHDTKATRDLEARRTMNGDKMNDPTNTEPVERLSEAWWAARSPEIRARRCSAHRRNGDQCAKVAMEAQKVCGTHGGRAPQAKAKARQRLDEAADRMARELLKIATTSESESVKLSAVRDALDRAGLKPPTQVEVGPKAPEPWEELLGDVAHITRAQHEAMKRGEYIPAPPTQQPALPPRPDDIVDAEVVDAPAQHREHDSPGADGTRQGDVPGNRPLWAEDAPTRPPSRELVTLEEAAAEVAQANRAAGVHQKGRSRR
ncbi:hypothetical protein MINTM020_47570 [Mycobacterium paraintracellulare]|nr:hypothetical protein MINTM001_50410 [Mycobacterium paraintracellulare]BCP12659.1 hypothetical protein MINTM020_47570 [Mycobacterium paraintracellulare]